MKRVLFAVMFLVGSVVSVMASDTVYEGSLIDGSVATDNTYILDLSNKGIDYLAFQAVTSTEVPNSDYFIDGVKSTGTIRVISNAGVVGSTLTIENNQYVDGIDWTHGGSSALTAAAIYATIASTYGVRATGYLLAYSTYSMTTSSITMYGQTFVQGTDWFVAPTVTGTMKSIYAVLSNTFNKTVLCQLNTSSITFTYNSISRAGNVPISVFITTFSASGMTGGTLPPLSRNTTFYYTSGDTVIYATATVVGAGGNSLLISSAPASLFVSGISGGVASRVNYALDRISSTQTWTTGLAVCLSSLRFIFQKGLVYSGKFLRKYTL